MSRQDLFRVGRNVIRNTPTTQLRTSAVDQPGTTLNIVMNGVSAVAEEVDARSAARWATESLSSSRDTDLDAYILGKTFGRLPRQAAAPSHVVLGISRPAAGASAYVPAGTAVVLGGYTFTLDAPGVTFASGEGGSGTVKGANFTCKTAGSATNVATTGPTWAQASTLQDPTLVIQSLVSLPSGQPYLPMLITPGLKLAGALGGLLVGADGSGTSFVTNAGTDPNAYAAGGADREQDPDYRARFLAYQGGLRANDRYLAAGALTVPGIAYAYVVEALDAFGSPAGPVTLYVADVNGRANAALLALVRIAIRGYRMPGQNVTIVGASPIFTTLVLSIAYDAGASIGDLQNAVRAAVVARVNSLGPGGSFQRADIAAAIRSVDGAELLSAYPYGVVTPAGDLVAASSTLFRTTADLVTFQ